MVCIREVREAGARWLHCPFPRPVQLYTQMSPLSLKLLQGEWRTRGVEKISIPQHRGLRCESHYYDLTSWGCRRICNPQQLEIWLWPRKDEWLTTMSTQHLQSQGVISTSNFAHLQNKSMMDTDQGNWSGCRSVWCGSSKSFANLSFF